MLEREKLLFADAYNPNPNPGLLPQLSAQRKGNIISLCRNLQALNVVELLCTSRYVVILYFGLAQKQPLGPTGHDRASRGLESGVIRIGALQIYGSRQQWWQ